MNIFSLNINSRYIDQFLNTVFLIFGLLCAGTLFIRVFLYLSSFQLEVTYWVSKISVYFLLFQEVGRFLISKSIKVYFQNRKKQLIFCFLVLLFLIADYIGYDQIFNQLNLIDDKDLALLYFGTHSTFLVISFITQYIRNSKFWAEIHLKTNHIFMLSFFMTISIGTILLKMPRSTANEISWLDAFFTATSAVCVTGLTTISITDNFTVIGQIVIMMLFQIGGIGIMTITMLFASFFTGSIALGESVILRKIFDTQNMTEARNIFVRISAYTFLFEAIGCAALIGSRTWQGSTLSMGLFFECVFHSISAFCNAGFSLFNQSLFAQEIRTNYSYSSVVMILIVIGGLGFPVIINLIHFLKRKKRIYNLRTQLTTHTKLVLSSTFALLLLGFCGIYLLEYDQSFNKLSSFDKAFQSLFLSVTSRTAGFNLWPTESLSFPTMALVILLMWIGGAPISTAGGIKCTTFAISVIHIINQLRSKRTCEIFYRQISDSTIQRALTVILGSMILLFISYVAMLKIESHFTNEDILFEIFSAWGTVGLSRGITGELSSASKIIIIFLMFCGRVGFFTVFSSFLKPAKDQNRKYLEDHITIY